MQASADHPQKELGREQETAGSRTLLCWENNYWRRLEVLTLGEKRLTAATTEELAGLGNVTNKKRVGTERQESGWVGGGRPGSTAL